MVRLSEDMIVARTRVSDMGHVKKLNCWGAELTDISVLRKLCNVEVLSLSVNSISTLEDISHCKNLQELYVRKNKIPEISEICWLRDLPRLKNLWLEENPCSEGANELYRLTVIKALPQLQKLDNVTVSSEEMAEAMRRGLDLIHPLDGGGVVGGGGGGGGPPEHLQPPEEEPPSRGTSEVEERRMSRASNYEPEYEYQRRESIQSPSRRVSNQVFEDARMSYSQSSNVRGQEEEIRRMSIREESSSRYSDEYRPQRSSYSGPCSDTFYSGRSAGQPANYGGNDRGLANYSSLSDYSSRSPQLAEPPVTPNGSGSGSYNPSRATTPLDGSGPQSHHHQPDIFQSPPAPTSLQTHGVPGSTPGMARQGSRAELRPVPEEVGGGGGCWSTPGSSGGYDHQRAASVMREETSDTPSPSLQMNPNDPQAIVNHHYTATYRQVDQQLECAQQLLQQRRSTSPQRPYPVRPKNRNSNVLSAILCLIKEIDAPSLEVVEMAVRCRMEELED